MTTCHHAVRAAEATAQLSTQINAGAQYGVLSIITHQQVQTPDLLILPYIKNPASLKKISPTKLTSSNFREWKNMMLAQFNYYNISRIIDESHLPPTVEPMLSYWLEIEELFILAFADSIPAGIFEETRIQDSLRDKWLNHSQKLYPY